MPTPTEALEASLGQLKADYRKRLYQQASKLERFQAALRSVQPNPALVQGIQFIAHSIHGSGKIFGFTDVSHVAGEVEDWLYDRSPTTNELPRLSAEEGVTLSALVGRLIQICREENPAEAPSPLLRAVPQERAKGFTVFLATPDESLHTICTRLLPPEGITLEQGRSGRELLDLLDSSMPDLILLDMDLPDTKTTNLLKTLRNQLNHASIPIMLVGGEAERAQAERSSRHECISKPVRADKLLAGIRGIREKLQQRIVLVDDDPLVLKLLKARFEQRGFEVITAPHGEEGWKTIQEQSPALVILDRTMPHMEGLTVLQHMKASPEHKQIPVILLTARHEKQDILEGLESGADDYIVKPFVPEELMIRSLRLLGICD